ncbi:hypothetical protein Gorai_013354, partial [Gossypium raimondii]|nr:hypothetical protein [Gossypium raimondii]
MEIVQQMYEIDAPKLSGQHYLQSAASSVHEEWSLPSASIVGNADLQKAEKKRKTDKAYRERCKMKKEQMMQKLETVGKENEDLKTENQCLKERNVFLNQSLLSQTNELNEIKHQLDDLRNKNETQNTLVQTLSHHLALVKITKGVDEQIDPRETLSGGRIASRSRDILSALEDQVANLEGSMGYVKETLEVVEGHTAELDLMEEKFREFLVESLNSKLEAMQGVFSFIVDRLTVRDDDIKVVMMNLKEKTKVMMKALNMKIEELEGELVVCKVIVASKLAKDVYYGKNIYSIDQSATKTPLEMLEAIVETLVEANVLRDGILNKDASWESIEVL